MKAPTRFLDDPSLQAGLRADLQHYAEQPPPYDVVKGAAGLTAALAALDAAPVSASEPNSLLSGAGATSAATGSWPVVTKLLVVVVGAGAIGSGAYQLAQRESPATPAPNAQVHAPAAVPQPSAPLEAVPVLETNLPPAAAAEPAAATSSRERRDSASRREIAQLVKIRELLGRDPAAAYRLAETSQREFPRGALREEREGLAVVALFGMGESARAQLEAARFLARYPHSALRERIRRWSEESAPQR